MSYADVKSSISTLSVQVGNLNSKVDDLGSKLDSLSRDIRNISTHKCEYKDNSQSILDIINTLDKSIGLAFGDLVTRISNLQSVANNIRDIINSTNFEVDNGEVIISVNNLKSSVETLMQGVNADINTHIDSAGRKIDSVRELLKSMDKGYSREVLATALSGAIEDRKARREVELGIYNFRKGHDVEFIVSSEEVDTSVTFNMKEVESPDPCIYSTYATLKDELGQFKIKIPAEDTIKLKATRYKYGLTFRDFDGRAVESKVGYINVLKEV